MSYKLFSSESVSEGHPDKIADQISDAVLDAIIAIDPDARVACETLIKNNTVFIAGEITTDAQVDVEQVARNVLFDIGYNDAQLGIDSKSCSVVTLIGHQSSDIAIGVDATDVKELGAGDQGTMFGFACTETDVLMPLPIYYAHKLMQKHAEVRKNGTLKWLRPDAKTQLTVRYVDYQPVSIDIIVFSTQHAPEISLKELKEAVIETIIKPVLPTNLITTATKFFINHTGAFIIGGPVADSGLTGRKIIVDTYGGIAKHGGGAFSGKDPTKVDRSGAYMARHIAKSIVAAGYADRCEIQVSYAIGAAKPVAIHLECFGTNKLPEESILQLINTVFDFRPARIIEYLQLQNPIYRATSNYGHFGRAEFSWERVAILSNKIHQNAISWQQPLAPPRAQFLGLVTAT